MRWRFLALPLMAATTGAARAQLGHGQGSGEAASSLTGIVIDSLRRRPLAGAEVVVAGTTLSALTDSSGRFYFESIPAGRYQLAFFHPLLDSMSVASAPRALSIPVEAGKAVLLAVPSAATLMRTICRVDSTNGRSILVGRVRDPDSGSPVAG